MKQPSQQRPVNPLIALVRQHMDGQGLDRKLLGDLLSSGGNRSKSFRRLDEFLAGELFLPHFVKRLGQTLQIPAEQLAVAWEVHNEQEEARRAEKASRAAQEAVERRGPHLWGLMPKNYHPSLITVLGAEFFLLVKLPEEFAELPHYEMTVEVGKAVREHYQNHRRCRLIGYEFRQPLSAVYRFDTKGEYLNLNVSGIVSSSFLKIGGKLRDTTSRPYPETR